MSIKAISIKEPWISRIVSGEKTIEMRTWRTNHRGPLLLVGSRTPRGPFSGRTACLVELAACRPMTRADEKAAGGKARRGPQAWVLRRVRRLRSPFPVKGRLGLYTVRARASRLETVRTRQGLLPGEHP